MLTPMDTGSIIDRLGGARKTAEICKVTASAVANWRERGIPPRHWRTIVSEGVDGITFDAIEAARKAHRQ